MWVNHEKFLTICLELERQRERAGNLAQDLKVASAFIDELKTAIVAERKRSDSAIDRLLNSKGLPAVTPPDKVTLEELSSMFEETPEGVAAIHKAIEEHGIEEVLFEAS